MNIINTKTPLYVVLLLGIILLGNSCKRGLEIQNQPEVVVNEAILKAKAHVESILEEQGSNSFVKKMGFEINWEKAIIDSANHVRVPIYFDLGKLKAEDGKQIAPAKTKNVFELYIKNVSGQTEVSIMQFMNVGGKYYPLRYTLAGELKTKLKASIFKKDVLSVGGNGNKILSSAFNKKMIYDSEFIELVQLDYGSGYVAVMIAECPSAYWFDPINCNCDYYENVTSGAFYPEIFMVIITASSSYQIVPYPYSFHPSGIQNDPEYPDEPVDNQVKDCAGVTGGNAYNTCCGCIGGSTGISDCSEFSDSPTLTPTGSVAQVSPSSDAIAALSGYWGVTYREAVDLEIGASLEDCIWTAVLVSANGKYSVQARIYPGVSEVVGHTTSSNFCAQLADLKSLTKGVVTWYTLSAVVAHENVHVSRLSTCMQASLPTIKTAVSTLHVPATGQTKAQAISELKALAQFLTVKRSALEAWGYASDYLADIDHLAGAACDVAEKGVITPVATAICSSASTSSWGACSNCPFSF